MQHLNECLDRMWSISLARSGQLIAKLWLALDGRQGPRVEAVGAKEQAYASDRVKGSAHTGGDQR